MTTRAKKKSAKTATAKKKKVPATPSREIEALRAKVRTLTAEKRRLAEQLAGIEAECKRYFDQFVDVEVANANVANLYVASLRLHSTLERAEVLTAIQEIVVNLVGSEEVAVLEVDDAKGVLKLVTSFGLDAEAFAALPQGEGILGWCARTGKTWVAAEGGAAGSARAPRERDLTACIPLVQGKRVLGIVAIFKLLEHKRALEEVDHELFALLGTQGGAALYCADLARGRN